MELLSQLMKIVRGEEGTLKERIFCTISLVGGLMAIASLLETLPMANVYIILGSLGVLIFALILGFILIVRHHALTTASLIVGFILCGMVLPCMFFFSGGISGGATVWLTINLVYSYLMFEGKTRYVAIAFNILVDLFCYGMGYHYPDLIKELPSKEAIYFDSLFSVVMVGLAIGFMVQVYTSTYTKQRKLIEKQNAELEKAGESKNRFFASMSHELRTPINTIIGLNELILRTHTEGEVHDNAESVQNASKMLLSLVNDILDMSQMELKKMEVVENTYSFSEILRSVVDMIEIQMNEKKLDFQLDIDEHIPDMLIGDKKRIQQILINLLTNAVKYTNAGSVTLGAQIEEQRDGEILLRITVRDTGIGIKKENLESLYESFKRVDLVRNENVQGSGLGLTITKQLVDLMNGEISVDSIYSKGSTFTVMLPQKVDGEEQIGSLEKIFSGANDTGVYHQSFEAPEARILVVDDNAMNLKVVKSLLAPTAVQVEIALSGAECLEKTSNRFYHVILLDHQMPGMDGVETLSYIRGQENGLCRESAIIALTANAGSEARNHYRELGFDDYLEKPIDTKLLEQYILGYLPDEIIEVYNNEKTSVSGRKLDIKRVKHVKKQRVMITTDCVADLPEEIIKKYGLEVMYLYIKTENGRFADTREINSDNLPQYLTDNSTTAVADSVSIEEYEEFFASQLEKAEQVIHISMASNSGKSYNIAMAAAQGFDHVHIIDAQHISCGQGMQVIYAAKLAFEGYSVDEIIKKTIEYRDHLESCFIMPTSRIFYQHGYTSSFVGKIFDVLHLHPVLKMKNSRISIVGFEVGNMDVTRTRFIRKKLRFKRGINSETVYITHVGLNVKQQQMVREEICKYVPFDTIYMEKASFSCACNTGMGTFGFSYYTK